MKNDVIVNNMETSFGTISTNNIRQFYKSSSKISPTYGWKEYIVFNCCLHDVKEENHHI